ncbi:MAG: NAD+ synthase [Candidatus Protistobacter heckmanni]|nr:NAD+ synthase [Candidatus Protistobacter heckmanni]
MLSPARLRIALAQINLTVGDFDGNARKILDAAREAHAKGADLLLTPELSLCGYPPEDLLLRPGFIDRCQAMLDWLTKEMAGLDGLHVVVGHAQRTVANLVERVDGTGIPSQAQIWNAASVLLEGRVAYSYAKQELPNNEVFDELRYFRPGDAPCVFDIKGTRVGLIICEDAWHPHAAVQAQLAGAQLILVPNASPYHIEKEDRRENILRHRVLETGMPHVYVNLVGGQDELIFDGSSFAMDRGGETLMRMPQFEEGLDYVELAAGRLLPGKIALQVPTEAKIYTALRMGVADYVNKNGFPGAIIGLSGGVDSALVLAVAVDALGVDKVRAVMMPSRYTVDISWEDAREISERLGVKYDEIPIMPMVDAFEAALACEFAGLKPDATEENIQARVRSTLLMALSNKSGRIVLTTGNKSEMAVGYCTLYGDMAGGFAVIKDISKTLVYRLCAWRNAQPGQPDVIPERILTRAPSAELRENQKDQDSLPPYEVLDGILAGYMEQDQSSDDLIAAGYKPEDVHRVVRLIKLNEYKRQQAPVGIRVTHRAFGRDWRYPITSRFKD